MGLTKYEMTLFLSAGTVTIYTCQTQQSTVRIKRESVCHEEIIVGLGQGELRREKRVCFLDLFREIWDSIMKPYIHSYS